ncbi:hypothetical protein GGI25_000715 [Coemansia spiralis]|uniref:Arrestin C-terminal-like domain-containing protein n=2 Tax=Coemansia TaxID=4863 RepID=A0A9W8GBY3_9FUNG|nr:hypothetical protein EDC05_000672 [Coemansia umbellata]KAJ2623658.1 hypothetical protein GGI26_002105 [Coemansia sp. RSA 1358]KAJ2680423.1 hypothetical protein GGI25_000715 [Coemansia spiralis]
MIKHNRLEFELDQPDIVLRGMVDDAPGTVFSGRLVVNLSEPIRVKGLTMALEGHEHLEWEYHNDGAMSTFHRNTAPIMHQWTFFTTANGKKIETWEAGRHEFPFSLVFPGNLPESINIPYAKVSYQLKAVLRRTGIMPNISAKHEIQVKRDLTMDGAFGTGAIDVENCWREKLEFRISSEADTFKPGDSMLATFKFQPLVKQMHLTKIGVILKEYVRCHTPLGNAEKTVSRVAAFAELIPDERNTNTKNLEEEAIYDSLHELQQHTEDTPLPPQPPVSQLSGQVSSASLHSLVSACPSHSASPAPLVIRDSHSRNQACGAKPAAHVATDPAKPGIDLTHAIEEHIRLRIPSEMKRLQYDHISSYIEVTHKLKFSIHFRDPDQHPHTLWVSVPISVVPTIAGEAGAFGSDLPTYANAALDTRIPMAAIEQGPPTYDTVIMESISCLNSQEHSSASESDTSSNVNLASAAASVHSSDELPPPLQQTPADISTISALPESVSASTDAMDTDVSIGNDSLSSSNDYTIDISDHRMLRRISHARVSVDSSRPLVHPSALHNFLRRPVVFPASAEATPLATPLETPHASPAITPVGSPLLKATENLFPGLLANAYISPSQSQSQSSSSMETHHYSMRNHL